MLVVAPHADDEVLGAGGLVALAQIRGWRVHVLYATVAGYRVSPGQLENLTEIPQNLFPLQFAGLQQTFRQRERPHEMSHSERMLAVK